ncbi:uncharacterized protein EI90DRAFT_2855318, partial [Cantharellus anzutake]|uniref:uncharacterized protein n=1 Tax=Cantharellus anzutake TaxID=1750568 RepID=UPI001907D83F
GCAMHKDLNTIKAGAKAMGELWARMKSSHCPGPIALPAKGKSAPLNQHATLGPPGIALAVLPDSGAIRLTMLAGILMNNKDDKKGCQDMHHDWFRQKCGCAHRFPDTSNTRFGSHLRAAIELFILCPEYIEFMEFCHNKKINLGYNNMEENIYRGLHDPSTITELAVLSLIGQAVSFPYMKSVCSNNQSQKNMLEMGPFHEKVKAHIAKIIQNPDLVLDVGKWKNEGNLLGEGWEDPLVFDALKWDKEKLPYLCEMLIAFCKGTLQKWSNFTTEFAPDGTISSMSPDEKHWAFMPTTNDANEGMLGTVR